MRSGPLSFAIQEEEFRVSQVLDFDEALQVVLERAAVVVALTSETVDLLSCEGRVLAESLRAERDQPPFDRSTRDGFAVRSGDVEGGRSLRLAGELRAGEIWAGGTLKAGTAVEIMTGAPVPEGADAVVMIEHVDVSGELVTVEPQRRVEREANIVRRGSEARGGEEVLPAGTPIGAAEIALAAASGYRQLQVYRRPEIAIVATGDELVELDAIPESQQIRNSNSYALAALVEAAGGHAERLPIARDLREELWERIARGRMSNLLLFSGGVSMGKYDLVEEVLAEFGAEFLFTGVRMQPGKPVVFGRLPERSTGAAAGHACLFFGLPGNPVSTQVTFHCFVEPLLRAMGGAGVEAPRFAQATLSEDVPGKPGLMRMLPARLTSNRVRPQVRLVGWQGSADLAANARANCYAVLPPDVESFRAGDVISVLLR